MLCQVKHVHNKFVREGEALTIHVVNKFVLDKGLINEHVRTVYSKEELMLKLLTSPHSEL